MRFKIWLDDESGTETWEHKGDMPPEVVREALRRTCNDILARLDRKRPPSEIASYFPGTGRR